MTRGDLTRIGARWVGLCVVVLGLPRLAGVAVDAPVGAVALLAVLVCVHAVTPPAHPTTAFRRREPEAPEPARDRLLTRTTWAMRTAHEPRAWADEVRPLLTRLAADRPGVADDPVVRRVLAAQNPPAAADLAVAVERITS